MDIDCAACNATLSVTTDQIGQSVRCPGCGVVMEVHPLGTLTDSMVSCPACDSKLVIPESPAINFRCPKCSQHLAKPDAVPEVMPIDAWSDSGASFAGDPAYGYDQGGYGAPDALGFGAAPPSPSKPSKQSSTAWRSETAYSDLVPSMGPGVMLLLLSVVGILLNAVFFFYAVGINDPERLTEANVRYMKTFFLVSSLLGGLYMSLIAFGSTQMIMRQRLWAGRTASILAILPMTVFAYGNLCFGVIAYPLFLGAGIWGTVVLFGRYAKR